MPSYDVIRFAIDDGNQKRPMYIGWMPVKDLNLYSRVPSFKASTPQKDIAASLLQTPVDKWQRPLIEEKRDNIAKRYNEPGEFMPNPVLLSADRETNIKIELKDIDGEATGLHSLKINMPEGALPPLLILDGQHRIRGLAKGSRSKKQPMPFVLLYSELPDTYTPDDFAKIFAEVSTAADPLQSIHREWMRYAFELDTYTKNAHRQTEHTKSMEVAIHLCNQSKFGRKNNPFHDKIQFNPEKQNDSAVLNGFNFTALDVKDFARKEYYAKSSPAGLHLSPIEVAEQIARAISALDRLIRKNRTRNCFIGKDNYRHRYMEHAFVRSVLAKLRTNQTPNWYDILMKIGMGQNIWNFSSWVMTTGGNEGNSSRHIARNVMIEAVAIEGVPNGATDLPAFLQGDHGQIAFEVGSPASSKMLTHTTKLHIASNFRSTVKLNGAKTVRYLPQENTSNLYRVKITQNPTPTAGPSVVNLKAGISITRQTTFRVESSLYGGRESVAEITFEP